jgi:hypothetical protein
MRATANRERLDRLMKALGESVLKEGRVYLTGGASALLYGWREMTIDVDLKADPEPEGFFEAIAILKDRLDINIELASPDMFIPVLPGWEKRSLFINRFGRIDYYHYDFYSQALAKIERSHVRDLLDVESMFRYALIEKQKLWDCFLEIEGLLIRYPSIEPQAYRKRVGKICGQV